MDFLLFLFRCFLVVGGIAILLIPYIIGIQAMYFEKAYQRTLERYGSRRVKVFLLFLSFIGIIVWLWFEFYTRVRLC